MDTRIKSILVVTKESLSLSIRTANTSGVVACPGAKTYVPFYIIVRKTARLDTWYEIDGRVVLVMKCPKCGQEMEEGYVTLATTEGAWLHWSKHKKYFVGLWERVKCKRAELGTLMQNIPSSKKNCQSTGTRCTRCRLALFEY